MTALSSSTGITPWKGKGLSLSSPVPSVSLLIPATSELPTLAPGSGAHILSALMVQRPLVSGLGLWIQDFSLGSLSGFQPGLCLVLQMSSGWFSASGAALIPLLPSLFALTPLWWSLISIPVLSSSCSLCLHRFQDCGGTL